MLGGCANNIQEKTNVIVDDKFENKVIYPDDIDLKGCDEFPIFTGDKFSDLYVFVVDVSKKYYECSNKANVSQEFIKKVYKK